MGNGSFQMPCPGLMNQVRSRIWLHFSGATPGSPHAFGGRRDAEAFLLCGKDWHVAKGQGGDTIFSHQQPLLIPGDFLEVSDLLSLGRLLQR